MFYDYFMQHLILIKKLKLFLLLLNDANIVYMSHCLSKTYSTGSHYEHFFFTVLYFCFSPHSVAKPHWDRFLNFCLNVVYCYAEYFPMTALWFCICAFCSLGPVYWAIAAAPNKMCVLFVFVLSKIY